MPASDALAHASRQLVRSGHNTVTKFEWIVVMGGIFAFLAAFGIGASALTPASTCRRILFVEMGTTVPRV